MANKKKDWAGIAVGIGVGLMIVIAIIVFLTSKDGYQGKEITGAEALALQTAGFWVWVVIGSLIGLVATYVGLANAIGFGSLGEKLQGKMGFTIACFIVALLAFSLPWVKVANDKVNGGITAPLYKPQ